MSELIEADTTGWPRAFTYLTDIAATSSPGYLRVYCYPSVVRDTSNVYTDVVDIRSAFLTCLHRPTLRPSRRVTSMHPNAFSLGRRRGGDVWRGCWHTNETRRYGLREVSIGGSLQDILNELGKS
ncbi:hypothetical protein EVAR_3446_1 [Eumeta japonica]|uniref:Uncharacterized protein n=1 Tax=Eumeta variegata TaxID=151549 RepID=A0A4C1ST86_EUMVA|nr:hypothetical protein EVAR_3446_1 [Eumeta japonica]